MKGTINVDYEFLKKHHLNFAANYANIGNDIFENTDDWLDAPDFSGYAVGYGFETFLGPIELKYSWSPEVDESRWFFNLGFWF